MSDGEPHHLHFGSVALDLIRKAPSTVLAIPAAIAVTSDVTWPAIAALAVAAAVVSLMIRWIHWRRFTYRLTPDALVIESGVLSRQRRTIPFDRVEDVDIERPLLARLFGLAKVSLETGGSGSDEGSLDSVSLAEAHRLRDVIRGRAVPLDLAVKEAAPLFAMSIERVLLFGLFNFSLVWLAVIGAAAQYGEARVWRALLDDGLLDRLGESARGASVFAWALIALVLLALGVGAGVVRTVLREHGYRLTDEGERLRRVRGLFTRSEVAIARRRVQLTAVDTGPVRRALGWMRVSAQTLGGDGDAGWQALAPFARADEADRVLAALGAERPAEGALTPVASGHVWRAVVRNAAVPVLLALGVGVVAGPIGGLLALPLLAPSVVLALLARRHHRWRLADGRLSVVRGVLKRTTWTVPVTSVQSVGVRRGWLQRRLGLATLVVDTAGARMLGGPHIHDLKEADAWALARQLSG